MSHRPSATPCSTRHAVILAAGQSKRTRPLTEHRPKPLIPLLDRPLLAHILDEMVGLVERVTLVVGYRADMVRQAFGRNYRGIIVDYVTQHEVNGTAGALLAVAAQVPLDAPFFLLYGDNLIARADLLRVCQRRYSLAALPVDEPSAFGILATEGDRVHGIIEKPPHAPPGSLANPGIYHFDPDVLPYLQQIQPSPRGELELTDLIGLLAAAHPVHFATCAGWWVPVGTPWDVLIAAQFVLQQRRQKLSVIRSAATIGRGCRVNGHITIGQATIGAGCSLLGPVMIGDGAVIGPGCLLDRAVIGAGTVVGANCTIEGSVTGVGCTIGAGSTVQSSLLDDSVTLGAHCSLLDATLLQRPPPAATLGLLADETMQQRGVVLALGSSLPAGSTPAAGGIVL